MGAGGKLMPLTQQPSFEAVKTLDVRPSTRAGNSKTTSYIPRRVLYTEPMTQMPLLVPNVTDPEAGYMGMPFVDSLDDDEYENLVNDMSDLFDP
jgi:hypothetical protein